MKKMKLLFKSSLGLLVLLIALPMASYAQVPKNNPEAFTQQELDQMLAPIALYPDSLLAQILMASTYPLEVIMANRWLKENQTLQGDNLNDALDKQRWDVSVKALVPFPEVLSMMSEKLDWTPMLGEAFLAQEEDVIQTVQRLRQKAHEAGNLKSSEEQTVTVEKEIIVIHSADPQVVYVPFYDPWWVYGSWWWPAYPPYVCYSYPIQIAFLPGRIWFGPRFFVGPYWGRAWGHWDWRNRYVYANVNRNINVNRRQFHSSEMQQARWRHDPTHRRNVAYRNPVSRTRFSGGNRNPVERPRDFQLETKLRNSNRAAGPVSSSKTSRPDSLQTGNPALPGKKGGIDRRSESPGVSSPPSRSPSEVGGTPGKTANRPAVDNSRDANSSHGNRPVGGARGQGSRDPIMDFGGYSHAPMARGGFGGGSMGGGRGGGPMGR